MKEISKLLALVADPNAKTEAYYSKTPTPVIDGDVVSALKARLVETGGPTVRVCLHEDPSADLHQMIIVHRRGGNFPQHMHLKKDESYQMIEGVLRIEIFADSGEKKSEFRLGGPGTDLPFLARVRKGFWHATIPETEFAVFSETRPGPFQGGDSVFR